MADVQMQQQPPNSQNGESQVEEVMPKRMTYEQLESADFKEMFLRDVQDLQQKGWPITLAISERLFRKYGQLTGPLDDADGQEKSRFQLYMQKHEEVRTALEEFQHGILTNIAQGRVHFEEKDLDHSLERLDLYLEELKRANSTKKIQEDIAKAPEVRIPLLENIWKDLRKRTSFSFLSSDNFNPNDSYSGISLFNPSLANSKVGIFSEEASDFGLKRLAIATTEERPGGSGALEGNDLEIRYKPERGESWQKKILMDLLSMPKEINRLRSIDDLVISEELDTLFHELIHTNLRNRRFVDPQKVDTGNLADRAIQTGRTFVNRFLNKLGIPVNPVFKKTDELLIDNFLNKPWWMVFEEICANATSTEFGISEYYWGDKNFKNSITVERILNQEADFFKTNYQVISKLFKRSANKIDDATKAQANRMSRSVEEISALGIPSYITLRYVLDKSQEPGFKDSDILGALDKMKLNIVESQVSEYFAERNRLAAKGETMPLGKYEIEMVLRDLGLEEAKTVSEIMDPENLIRIYNQSHKRFIKISKIRNALISYTAIKSATEYYKNSKPEVLAA